MAKLIGPFKELVTLSGVPVKGSVNDEQLCVISDAGVVVENGLILAVGVFAELKAEKRINEWEEIAEETILLPGFVDAHTHICWAGSRAGDFALRNSGVGYLEIARRGGGIWETVSHTRAALLEELIRNITKRAKQQLSSGITTIEVKSGYGLTVKDELKMLYAIQEADAIVEPDLIATCLAAHIVPKEFSDAKAYLSSIINDLLPVVKKNNLASRVDIFIEETAYDFETAETYLRAAKSMGFEVVVHADQFHVGGSEVAARLKAVSADHLEASSLEQIKLLANQDVACMVLPGASIGVGGQFAPARKILDAGAALVIASDWNPGSAPNGDLLMQASILAAYEKLSNAEVLAGVTFRAAKALGLNDRGKIEKGFKADLVAFPCSDYREITYQQGRLKPSMVWKNGVSCKI